jgi:hypothetical protein
MTTLEQQLEKGRCREVCFIWCPSHMGIQADKEVDKFVGAKLRSSRRGGLKPWKVLKQGTG